MMVPLGKEHVCVVVMLVTSLAVLVRSQSGHTETNCDQIKVNNQSYEQEILFENLDYPGQLTIDYDTNTLFFSHTTYHGLSSAFLNLETNKLNEISGVYEDMVSVIDNHNSIVYLGGDDGIYKFDYETETATLIEGTNHNIRQMFFKKHVIFTTIPTTNVYMFKDGQCAIIPEFAGLHVAEVAQNNNLDYYFRNYTGLFKLQRVNGEIISLGKYDVNKFFADHYGNLYFLTYYKIYSINDKDEVVQIAAIDNILGVAIESDTNIIYSTPTSIVRLKPASRPCSPQ